MTIYTHKIVEEILAYDHHQTTPFTTEFVDVQVVKDLDLIIDSGGKLKGKHLFGAVYKIDKLFPTKTDIFELSEVIKPSQTYTAIINEGITIYER